MPSYEHSEALAIEVLTGEPMPFEAWVEQATAAGADRDVIRQWPRMKASGKITVTTARVDGRLQAVVSRPGGGA